MKWFAQCGNLDEVKATYKKLAKEHHPDLGGDTALMQEINKAYAFASAKVIKGENLSAEDTEREILQSEAYREALEKIIHLKGITIELVGYWIWVTGETREHKDELKKAGFYYASKKIAWYFRTGEYKAKKGGLKSLDEIRVKYGTELISDNKPKNIYIRS